MNEHLPLEKERGRPYGVLVCFVPRSLKERYVRGAKMRRGRTISGFIREAMELLIAVEERLLKKVELLTYEYAESEYLGSRLRPRDRGAEAIDRSASIRGDAIQAKTEEQGSAVSVTLPRKTGESNPVLAFIEAKNRTRL